MNKYRSDAMAAVHGAMVALHKIGTIDEPTMREFDEACLTRAHFGSGTEAQAENILGQGQCPDHPRTVA